MKSGLKKYPRDNLKKGGEGGLLKQHPKRS